MARHLPKAANLTLEHVVDVGSSLYSHEQRMRMEAVANRRSFHLRERRWIAPAHVLSCQTLWPDLCTAAQLRVFPYL